MTLNVGGMVFFIVDALKFLFRNSIRLMIFLIGWKVISFWRNQVCYLRKASIKVQKITQQIYLNLTGKVHCTFTHKINFSTRNKKKKLSSFIACFHTNFDSVLFWPGETASHLLLAQSLLFHSGVISLSSSRPHSI